MIDLNKDYDLLWLQYTYAAQDCIDDIWADLEYKVREHKELFRDNFSGKFFSNKKVNLIHLLRIIGFDIITEEHIGILLDGDANWKDNYKSGVGYNSMSSEFKVLDIESLLSDNRVSIKHSQAFQFLYKQLYQPHHGHLELVTRSESRTLHYDDSYKYSFILLRDIVYRRHRHLPS